MAGRHRNMSHKAAASSDSRYLDDEDAVKRAASELTRKHQIQCPPCLLAQLSGLLFYPSTSVSISMLGFFQCFFKFRIEQIGCNVTLASAF
jgi:hypothetical protein